MVIYTALQTNLHTWADASTEAAKLYAVTAGL